MRVRRSVLAILAAACVSVAVPRTAAADEWNKETVLTFSRNVEIPGKVLPAGKYLFRLADTQTNRHVVQVFDQAHVGPDIYVGRDIHIDLRTIAPY